MACSATTALCGAWCAIDPALPCLYPNASQCVDPDCCLNCSRWLDFGQPRVPNCTCAEYKSGTCFATDCVPCAQSCFPHNATGPPLGRGILCTNSSSNCEPCCQHSHTDAYCHLECPCDDPTADCPRRLEETPRAIETSSVVPQPAAFLVIKGYLIGSTWFTEQFNAIPGLSFFFEFEHCLQQFGANGSLAPAEFTARHLRQTCGAGTCPSRTARGQVIRTTQRCALCRRGLDASPAAGQSCIANGISFGVPRGALLDHVQLLPSLMPQLRVLAHIRTNHVKHAISFLRAPCPRSRTSAEAKIHVHPAALLIRVREVAASQLEIVALARSIDRLRYTIVYERMQADPAAELRRVLEAIGVPAAAVPAASTAPPIERKRSADDLAASLVNFEELARLFAPLGCLGAMLRAASTEAFELARCAPPLIATVDAATAVPRPSHLMSRRPRRGIVAPTVDPVDPILAAQMRNRSLVEEASGCPVVSGT